MCRQPVARNLEISRLACRVTIRLLSHEKMGHQLLELIPQAKDTMGAVYEEFERELAAIRKACADDPRCVGSVIQNRDMR